MSDARSAMPSSRIFAPSLTSAKTRRWTIASSPILRGVMPISSRCCAMSSSTTGSGIALRLAASYRYQPVPVFGPYRPSSQSLAGLGDYL